ncbi:MAG: EF-P 5-aminopentanol modification-associated protein YfmF [Traorella sp.]
MKYELAKNVHLSCIKSTKFKDIGISINFFSKNENNSNTIRSLLSMMMIDRCEKYDTKKKMSDVCDHLFGCSLGSRVVGYGQAHCIEIRSKIIDPVYIYENHNILNDWLNLLHEIIFNPLLDENIFEENKSILTSRIYRKEDDSQSYTISKAFELAGENQALGNSTLGKIDILEKIKLEDIKQEHQHMLHYDFIEIVLCGNFEENQLIQLITSKLSFHDRKNPINTYYVINHHDYGIKKEAKNQPQTTIAMIYSTGIDVTSPEYPALKVANGILGQFPSSFLFQEVREHNSLCYSISSFLISYDGACLISTGIDKENIQKTLDIIHQQLIRCQNGEFDEELIKTTKKMIINGLTSSLDEMSSIMGYSLTNSLLNRTLTIDENMNQIMRITKEDCIKVFNKMKHMGTYICYSRENYYE